MRLGVTRHGPSAPDACQFGKYGLDEHRHTDLIDVEADAVVVGRDVGDLDGLARPLFGRFADRCAATRRARSRRARRSRSPGRGRSPRLRATSSSSSCRHPPRPPGSFSGGETISESATSKITHGPDVAISVTLRPRVPSSPPPARRHVIPHPQELHVLDALGHVERVVPQVTNGTPGAADSAELARKWYGVVADDSKKSPSIEPMQPSVQNGRTSSTSACRTD